MKKLTPLLQVHIEANSAANTLTSTFSAARLLKSLPSTTTLMYSPSTPAMSPTAEDPKQ